MISITKIFRKILCGLSHNLKTTHNCIYEQLAGNKVGILLAL